MDDFVTKLKKYLKVFSILKIHQLKFSFNDCPLHGKSVFVKLDESMLGVRCCLCGAAPIATSIATVLQIRVPDYRMKAHYELSSRGPFFEFLKKNINDLTFSEYLDNVKPGSFRNGVQCQDIQDLTYDDSSFEVVTSTEVFEHVPDDVSGFLEVHRVLRTGGVFIFTVPLSPVENTVTRAVFEGGKVKYLLEPTYHDDSIRGTGKVLVFRDYGQDILQRLLRTGFEAVEIVNVPDSGGFGFHREVIVAHK